MQLERIILQLVCVFWSCEMYCGPCLFLFVGDFYNTIISSPSYHFNLYQFHQHQGIIKSCGCSIPWSTPSASLGTRVEYT